MLITPPETKKKKKLKMSIEVAKSVWHNKNDGKTLYFLTVTKHKNRKDTG